MERTIGAIAGMVDEARQHDVAEIAAVGTAGMRIAPNSADLVDGGPGARLVSTSRSSPGTRRRGWRTWPPWLGSAGPKGRASCSTPAEAARSSRSDTATRSSERFSVDVGAVRFTERYGLDGVVSADVLSAALSAIAADLVRLDEQPEPDALVAMGGAVTNLAAVKHGLLEYDAYVVQGTVLDRTEIDRQIELYRTPQRRRASYGRRPAARSALRSSSRVHASFARCSTSSARTR